MKVQEYTPKVIYYKLNKILTVDKNFMKNVISLPLVSPTSWMILTLTRKRNIFMLDLSKKRRRKKQLTCCLDM